MFERNGILSTGDAVLTAGGNLMARYVIHAVGPVYHRNPESAPQLLAAAYRNSLKTARRHGVRRIAFPCISTGAYGYPQQSACDVAVATVREDIHEAGMMDQVVFCTYESEDYEIYWRQFQRAAVVK
jgi:O-acetyl-ADP-ribose deacetylase (regulator of RNase III)